MKRDMELVRKILLAVEEHDGHPSAMDQFALPDYPTDQVSYHVRLLKDAGWIEAKDLSTMHRSEYVPQRLTWAGHEFVNASRNETVWKKTKELISEKGGSVSLEAVKAILTKTALALFGL